MNRRNMFAIWPLIVRGRNRRRKQESIKGLSGVCACVCLCGCMCMCMCMLRGSVLRIPNAAWGYGKTCASGGSVNIIQTLCVCDLQHSTASATVFLGKGEGFYAGSEGQANRGLDKPTALCRAIQSLHTHTQCRHISDRGPSTCPCDKRSTVRLSNMLYYAEF